MTSKPQKVEKMSKWNSGDGHFDNAGELWILLYKDTTLKGYPWYIFCLSDPKYACDHISEQSLKQYDRIPNQDLVKRLGEGQ